MSRAINRFLSYLIFSASDVRNSARARDRSSADKNYGNRRYGSWRFCIFSTLSRLGGSGSGVRVVGVVVKHSCAALSKLQDAECDKAKREVTSRPRGHRGGLFITAFQQLTRDRTCSRVVRPALVRRPRALIEPSPCFIFIRDRMDAVHFHAVPERNQRGA